jgi:hypothetical protein
MLPVIVLYDAVDAQRFAVQRPPARAVCPLTPLAASTLKATNVPVLNALDRYGDEAQASTIRLRETVRRSWHSTITAKGPLDPNVMYVLDLALVTLLNGYGRLRYVIGEEGPWLVPAAETWTEYSKQDEACRAISRHILARYWNFIGNIVFRPPPVPALFRVVRRAIIAAARRGKPVWVTSRSDHPLGLERALMSDLPAGRQIHLTVADMGWREYVKLSRELVRALGSARQIQIRAVPRNYDVYERQARTAIEDMPDGEFKALMKDFAPQIAAVSGIAAGASEDFKDILSRLKPDFMLASEISDAITSALFRACGDARVVRRVASHNSFAPVQDEIGLIALKYQLGGQYAGGAAEQNLFWNPPSLAAGRQILSKLSNRCTAIAAKEPCSEKRPKIAEKAFHILYATNSLRYFSGTSWLYEDVNEFIESVTTLVNAGLSVDGTTYTVRTKVRRHEMSESTIRSRLREQTRVEVSFRHTRPFDDDLARADLLVAFRSTTIMQALFARKPVLLWGVSPRYRELSSRTTAPAPGDRAAVYSVTKPEDLPGMISGIKNAHWGKPLTDEELAPYVFPPGTMTIETWAKQCSTSAFA